MSWARLDDQMAFHAKIVAAGNEAVGAWVRLLTHSCAQLTDGRVTREIALTITRPKVLEDLVKVRLLDRVEDGFRVHDFLDWNPPAAEVKAKREAERKRKESARKALQERRNPTNASVNRPAGHHAEVLTESGGCPDTPSRPTPVPSYSDPPNPPESDEAPESNSPSETRLRADPFGDNEIASAWAAGVTEGAEATMSAPRSGELRALLALAADHGPPREGMHGSRNVAAWARERGKAYGLANRGQVRNVFRFKDFVNAPDAKPGPKRAEAPSAPAIERFVPPPRGFNSQGERVDYDVPAPSTFRKEGT